MKNVSSLVGLCLFLVASTIANAGIPSMNVTISDSSGRAAFKGATKSDGGFATAKLEPGNYVVQFKATNSSVKSGQYSIVVAAGKKKVVANAVAGEMLLGGGVAMKVEVGAGLSIIGRVVVGASVNSASPTGKDGLGRMQDRAQDAHQEGFRTSTSELPSKMTRP